MYSKAACYFQGFYGYTGFMPTKKLSSHYSVIITASSLEMIYSETSGQERLQET
jgi:hypothetical protein